MSVTHPAFGSNYGRKIDRNYREGTIAEGDATGHIDFLSHKGRNLEFMKNRVGQYGLELIHHSVADK